jgi:hypothetical protein
MARDGRPQPGNRVAATNLQSRQGTGTAADGTARETHITSQFQPHVDEFTVNPGATT